MRLLVDANLSPLLLAPLRDAGFDTTHVADIGLATATGPGSIHDVPYFSWCSERAADDAANEPQSPWDRPSLRHACHGGQHRGRDPQGAARSGVFRSRSSCHWGVDTAAGSVEVMKSMSTWANRSGSSRLG